MNNRKPKADPSQLAMGCAAIALLLTVVYIIAAVALMYGWSLFVSPVFGMAEITIRESFGAVLILVVISFLLRSSAKINRNNRRED